MITAQTAAGAVHLGAGVLLTGAMFLLLLAGPPDTDALRRWEARVLVWARGLALAALASGLAVLALQAAAFEGRPQAAWEPSALARVALETRYGAVWAIRGGLLALLTAWLFLTEITGQRKGWLAGRGEAFGLASAALMLMSGVSHAAAEWESAWSWGVDAAHLLGAGLWAGALPPLALLMATADPQAAETLRRFSHVAMATMAALALSGFAGVWLLTGDVAGLVGTTHGRLLLLKLVALTAALGLAASVRAQMPALPQPATARRISRLIAAEALVALGLIGLAAALRETSPAVGATPDWPLAFRIVVETASDALLWRRLADPPVAFALAAAVLLVVFAAVQARPIVLATTVLVVAAAGAYAALRPSAVEAFPTSFARSSTAYSADSIAQGMDAYRTHCVSCHGAPKFDGAKRNGGAVELLATESALRSAGDLFWLISHGDPARGMPGFAAVLSEAQRWGIVNFLRALANAGFCAAITSRVGDAVEPDKAWLAAPDLAIAVGPLTPKSLRDLRGKRMALIVLYALPASRPRLAELARRYGALSVQGLEIVAVPAQASPDAIAALGQTPPALFPVVTEGNEAIHAAYRMFAPGSAHAELLIDRQGYIRAIWRDAPGLPDLDVLQAQVEALNAEKAPPPPPDDHIH